VIIQNGGIVKALLPGCLQLQIIDGRIVQVGGLKVRLTKIDIVPDHIKCAVTQYSLKRENIAAISEVGDGESMSECVWGTPDIFDSSFLTIVLDNCVKPIYG